MTGRKELLDDEDRAWHELCARFARVGEEAWDRAGANGDWTPKDLMAHIACWHARCTDALEAYGATGGTPPGVDVDAFNADAYQRCRDLSLHDVRAMFESSRHRFREEASQVPDPVPDSLTRLIIGDGAEHYDDHIPDLDRFLQEAE